MGRSSARSAAAAGNNHWLVNFIYRNRAQRLNSNAGRDRNGRGVLGVRVFIVVTSVNVVVAIYRTNRQMSLNDGSQARRCSGRRSKCVNSCIPRSGPGTHHSRLIGIQRRDPYSVQVSTQGDR